MKTQIYNLYNNQTKLDLAKKFLVLCISSMFIGCAADNVATSVPTKSSSCDPVQAQVEASRDLIEQAYVNGDGCTVGNQEIKNHNIIQANLSCFPNFRKNDYNLFHVMDNLDTSLDSELSPSCDKGRATVMANHQKIKNALLKGDGCKAGKLQVQNYSIIKNSPACFPNFKDDGKISQAAAKYNANATDQD